MYGCGLGSESLLYLYGRDPTYPHEAVLPKHPESLEVLKHVVSQDVLIECPFYPALTTYVMNLFLYQTNVAVIFAWMIPIDLLHILRTPSIRIHSKVTYIYHHHDEGEDKVIGFIICLDCNLSPPDVN